MEAQDNKIGNTDPFVKVPFVHLPAFAEFILHGHFDAFVNEQMAVSEDLDYPLLRYFRSKSPSQIRELTGVSAKGFLNAAMEGTLFDKLEADLTTWKADKIPGIGRSGLTVEDITVRSFIRRTVLQKFLPAYTADIQVALSIVKEVDTYLLASEARSFRLLMDISREELEASNHQLSKHREMLLEAQEIANLGNFEWDISGAHQSFYSDKMLKILGMDGASNMAAFMADIHPGDREQVKEAISRAMLNGDFECEYRYMRHGKEKFIWSRGVVEFADGKPSVLRGTVMDITERHYILRRLERNEELYKQAQKIAHIGNFAYDLVTGHLTWSEELYHIYGLDPAEPITIQKARQFAVDGPARFESLLESIIENGGKDDITFRIIVDGEEKVLKTRREVLFDEAGKPYKIIGTTQDITRETALSDQLRKREENLATLNEELREMNEELKRSNEELSSFGYVASHDLQEPLRKIKTFADLLVTKEAARLSDEGKMLLGRVTTSAMRMQTLIQDLLAYSRTQEYTEAMEAVDLNQIVNAIIGSFAEGTGMGKPVFHTVHLPVVNGVPFQLQQLFENLIGNSVKYARKDAQLHIRISYALVSGKDIHGAPPAQNYECIKITDNGIGFDPAYSEKIFEIFQRLHSRSEYTGTGIGLAICRRIVENHKGMITATGVPGEGSIFSVFFPAH